MFNAISTNDGAGYGRRLRLVMAPSLSCDAVDVLHCYNGAAPPAPNSILYLMINFLILDSFYFTV